MTAYYNENDKKAAAWLRELIKEGHIADGEVDERSIEDVLPDELAGFSQHHFFAGIGGWSYALRLAGWPDERPIWTGSCPCQPFSAAGKGGGVADERHLWPAFFHLIGECCPVLVVGEQVASKDGLAWLDLVQADLEGAGYTAAAVDLCAAGIGAPHIRQRLFWMADGQSGGLGEFGGPLGAGDLRHVDRSGDAPSLMADSNESGLEGRAGVQQRADQCPAGADGLALGLGHADGKRQGAKRGILGGQESQSEGEREPLGMADTTGSGSGAGLRHQGSTGLGWAELADDGADDGEPATGPVNGHWRDADWLFCRDDKWRPVEPGTFPLAHGLPARVVRLRGYGNAIVPQAAAAFIEAIGVMQ